MQILLTGSTGFIGAKITVFLRKQHISFKTFCGDVRNISDWEKNISGGETILHFAGVKTETEKDFEVNTQGTKNLFLTAIKQRKIPKRVILASTCAVYLGVRPPFCEETHLSPITFYGKSKYQAETIAFKQAGKLGIEMVVLRLGTVVGGGIRLESGMSGPIAFWTSEVLKNRSIRVFQGGQQTRPYIHINDLTSAVSFALAKLDGGIYNVVGEQVTMKDLACCLTEAMGKGKTILLDNQPTAVDPKELLVSSCKLQSFGWQVTKTIKEGIVEFVAALNLPGKKS